MEFWLDGKPWTSGVDSSPNPTEGLGYWLDGKPYYVGSGTVTSNDSTFTVPVVMWFT